MNQFQVPQFIMIEDKVFGPFTIKQFLFLGSGALLILGVRMILQAYIFIPIAALIGGIAASFAFLKINEQPFTTVFRNAVFYYTHPRLYVWKKEAPQRPKPEETAKKTDVLIKGIPRLSDSKLSDLAWSLDIKSKR